jgi:nucleoside phosphorylase
MPTIDEQVSVIVVTALPIEQAAVKQILDHVEAELDGFIFGTVEFRGVALHRLAVGVLPQAGNSAAAAEASRWVARFPNARYIVMVGIAGGVPAPDDPERHVRLGDVVVPDAVGVREHDRGKVKEGVFEPMPGGGATPSAQFVSICRSLIGLSLIGEYAWKEVLDSRFSADVWSRPDESTDLLTPIGDPPAAVLHPDPDMYRTPGVPRLSAGLIASGNVVVKDADRRAVLASIGAVAVEMEGAGLATSPDLS